MADRDDESLMKAYVAGDDDAFDELFLRYSPTILRLGRRHLGSEEDARELLQQTFLRAHGGRHDYRPGERLHPWLMTIVMNLVRDQWRRRKRKPTAPLEHEPRAPLAEEGQSIERQRRVDGLHAALAKMPTAQREILELHWFQEQPYAQVAAMLDITEGAARLRAHRAYGRLKRLLVDKKGTDD